MKQIVYNQGMNTPTKEEIKLWLDGKENGYMWLAGVLAVSYQTVRAWMSTRSIPAAKLARIAEIMEAEARPAQESRPTAPKDTITAVAVMMQKSERALIMEAARLSDMSFEQFILEAGIEKAGDILKDTEEQLSLIHI